jgi:hypothetical protein
MSHLLWKDGINSLSELTAKLKVSLMIINVIVLMQDKVNNLIQGVLGSYVNLNDMHQVLQIMLAYWVWLKEETYWACGDLWYYAVRAHTYSIRNYVTRDLLRL